MSGWVHRAARIGFAAVLAFDHGLELVGAHVHDLSVYPGRHQATPRFARYGDTAFYEECGGSTASVLCNPMAGVLPGLGGLFGYDRRAVALTAVGKGALQVPEFAWSRERP